MELLEQIKNDSRSPRLFNAESILPTHVLPPRAHTPALPTSINHAASSSTNNTVAAPDETRIWMKHVKEYAPVVGVVGTIAGVVVAIITVVVK